MTDANPLQTRSRAPHPAPVSLFALTILLSGCASKVSAPQLDWLPDATGWTLREVDESEAPTWLAYDRDAPDVNVKEIRVAGLVDAAPQVTIDALRHRLLDEAYVPDGLEVEILSNLEEEVLTYGLASLPWPLRDREVTERMVFTHDPMTGVFRVDVYSVESEDEVPRGVLRVPLVRNTMVVAPTTWGTSVLTSDSIHDMGGAFPNWAIYRPVRKTMIDMLSEVETLSESFEDSSDDSAQ